MLEVFSQWKLRNPKDFMKSTLVEFFCCLFLVKKASNSDPLRFAHQYLLSFQYILTEGHNHNYCILNILWQLNFDIHKDREKRSNHFVYLLAQFQ